MTLLLTRTLSVRPREEALVLANIEELAVGGLSVPLALELMAEVSALVFPHRVLTAINRAVFRLPVGAIREVTCRAVLRGEGLLAEVLAPGAPGPEQVLAAGFLTLSDAPTQPPAQPEWETWMLDRRRRTDNAEVLYASSAERPLEIPREHRTLRWAYASGLGQLVGRIGPRGPHFGRYPQTQPTASSPGVVAAIVQLVEWDWYALAGELGRVVGIGQIDWYRSARAEEDLLAQVKSTGMSGSSPTFKAVAYGPDRLPVLRLMGIELEPQRVGPQQVPRLPWQSFVRAIDTVEV